MRGFGEERRKGFRGGESKFCCCCCCCYFVCLLFCFKSEVAGTRVAVVVELLLDVDHVAAGVFQLSELGPATEVSKVAELGQP